MRPSFFKRSSGTAQTQRITDIFVSSALKNIRMHAAAVEATLPRRLPASIDSFIMHPHGFISRQIVRAARQRFSWQRIGVLVLINLCVLEAGSWAGYWALTGHRLSFAQAQTEQMQIAEDGSVTDVSTLTGDGEGKMTQFVAHPYLGFIRKDGDPNAVPGQEFILGKTPFIITPAKDEVIIGIFGGSVAEQFSRSGSGALRNILARDPRFSGKRITIFTAAIGGYKQPQQLMALNYYLTLGQHFDAVINIDGFNEIAGPPTANEPKGVTPSFPSGWYHIADRLPDTHLLSLIGAVAYRKEERQTWAQTMLSSPAFSSSSTAQFLWKGWDRVLSNRVAGAQLALMHAPASTEKDTREQGLPYAYGDDATLMKDLVSYWQRSSEMMNEIAAAQGIPYLHFLQPNQYVPGSKTFSLQEQRSAFNMQSPYRRLVPVAYPLLRASGQKLRSDGVNFVDLTSIFKTVTATIYKDDCCHMNRAGNEMLSAAIGRELLKAVPQGKANVTAMQ